MRIIVAALLLTALVSSVFAQEDDFNDDTSETVAEFIERLQAIEKDLTKMRITFGIVVFQDPSEESPRSSYYLESPAIAMTFMTTPTYPPQAKTCEAKSKTVVCQTGSGTAYRYRWCRSNKAGYRVQRDKYYFGNGSLYYLEERHANCTTDLAALPGCAKSLLCP